MMYSGLYNKYYNMQVYITGELLSQALKESGAWSDDAIQAMERVMGFNVLDRHVAEYKEIVRQFKKMHGTKPRFKRDRTPAKGKENKHRVGIEYNISWVYAMVYPSSMTFKVKSIEHRGKRVEGVYEGDTTFPVKEENAVMLEITDRGSAKSAVDYITYALNKKGVQVTRESIMERVTKGDLLVYSIRLRGTWRKADIGYVVMSRGENVVESNLFIDLDALNLDYINPETVINSIVNTLNEEYEGLLDTNMVHNVV